MVRDTTEDRNKMSGVSTAQQERARQADAMYRKLCDEMGMRVCSWQEFGAWQEYVDEKIEDSQLAEKARSELQQFSSTFGKYLIVEKAEPGKAEAKTKAAKKERTKKANKIYKKVCDETGIEVCFFNNFSTWSEYVDGKMDDAEFYEKAKSEMTKMMQGNTNADSN